jgi:hypothetical protein
VGENGVERVGGENWGGTCEGNVGGKKWSATCGWGELGWSIWLDMCMDTIAVKLGGRAFCLNPR